MRCARQAARRAAERLVERLVVARQEAPQVWEGSREVWVLLFGLEPLPISPPAAPRESRPLQRVNYSFLGFELRVLPGIQWLLDAVTTPGFWHVFGEVLLKAGCSAPGGCSRLQWRALAKQKQKA